MISISDNTAKRITRLLGALGDCDKLSDRQRAEIARKAKITAKYINNKLNQQKTTDNGKNQ